MGKSVRGGSMITFRGVCRPALVAVAGVAILLSGCSQDAAKPEGPQAKPVAATTTQAQQDIEAKLAADVKKTKDDAAKAAEAKAAATNAAKAVATKAVATKAAAAKASKAQTRRCYENVRVSLNTTCNFAARVDQVLWGPFYPPRNHHVPVTIGVESFTTGVIYSMTCTPDKYATVCRGGNNAVVYFAATPTGNICDANHPERRAARVDQCPGFYGPQPPM